MTMSYMCLSFGGSFLKGNACEILNCI